ncbi:MAG: DUF1413 domain-containing protein [Oscillospiraceae bacterium]|nr:DUF1413 domain-containing protein [Oscillospiraceae bacterium]
MATFRFDLNEEYSERLKNDASARRMNIQEYIRFKLFGEVTIFSVDEVVRRVMKTEFKEKNKVFCVPDAYSKEEWSQIDRGNAGVLGKNFYIYITEHPELGIRFIPNCTIKRRASYTFLQED